MKITLTIKVNITNEQTKTKFKRLFKIEDMIKVVSYKVMEQFTARTLHKWETFLHKLIRFTPVLYYIFRVELTVFPNQINWVKKSDVIMFTDMDSEWIVLEVDNINNTILINSAKPLVKLPKLHVFIVLRKS